MKVAVIDEGVEPHEDLPSSRILPGYNFSGDNNDPSPGGNQAHGMAVAGIIAATQNNGIGISGVAPGVKILPIKVSDAYGVWASDESMADAIDYAWDDGEADIIIIAGAIKQILILI